MADPVHRVTVTVGGSVIDQWIDYDLGVSMVEPADVFTLTRAFSLSAWRALRLDAEVKLAIDGTPVLTGYIDEREKSSKDYTIKITGRCKSGRLVQESIPTATGLDGLQLTDAVAKLASPWYTKVSLSDARNRAVRRGKGGRAPSAGEPAIFNVKGKLDESHSGRVDPGEMRWTVIEQLCSSVQLLCWAAADGRELIIGKPNYQQAIQYVLKVGDQSTDDLVFTESVRDRYALIEAHGSGGSTDEDFGESTVSRLGIATDGPNPDGTGRDFLRPKRLVLSQRALASNDEGARAAEREMIRRDFNRRQVVVPVPLHGQRYRSDALTIFAPNTLARVIDSDLEFDDTMLIYEVRFRGSRRGGEKSVLKLVPRGTVFIA